MVPDDLMQALEYFQDRLPNAVTREEFNEACGDDTLEEDLWRRLLQDGLIYKFGEKFFFMTPKSAEILAAK